MRREKESAVGVAKLSSRKGKAGLNWADAALLSVIILAISVFSISETVLESYLSFTRSHGMLASFIKFALLATLGELIGLRIKTGNYYETGFGVLPRAIVWGFLGLSIKMAFVIFASGVPLFLSYCGLTGADTILAGTLSFKKVFVAACISITMNIMFAPLMMTFHKITDIHIVNNGGTVKGLFRPIAFRNILLNLNWDVQWNFVFMKTIPYFWIPAHTITFLLAAEFQVLFAALLGIALGTILALADLMDKK